MSKQFLITRPEHDTTTHYLSNWSTLIIEQANFSGIKTLDLHRERAVKKQVESIISKQNPGFVMFNGHGNAETICGHHNKPLIEANKNEQLLKDRVVFAISCSAGRTLGDAAIKNGTKAFIGYQDDFYFYNDETSVSRPLSDEVAKLYLEPPISIAISLLKGHTAGEAHEKAISMFNDTISKLMTQEAPEGPSKIVQYLWWNATNQVAKGDQKATI